MITVHLGSNGNVYTISFNVTNKNFIIPEELNRQTHAYDIALIETKPISFSGKRR